MTLLIKKTAHLSKCTHLSKWTQIWITIENKRIHTCFLIWWHKESPSSRGRSMSRRITTSRWKACQSTMTLSQSSSATSWMSEQTLRPKSNTSASSHTSTDRLGARLQLPNCTLLKRVKHEITTSHPKQGTVHHSQKKQTHLVTHSRL